MSVERVIRAFDQLALCGGRRAGHGRCLHGRVSEPHGLERLAVVDELSVQYFAGFERFAVGFKRLIKHAETVTLAQAAVKVDVARKNAGDLRGHSVRDMGFVGSSKQRGFDDTAGHPGRHAVGGSFEPGAERFANALDHQSLKVRVVVSGPTHRHLEQLLIVGGFGG